MFPVPLHPTLMFPVPLDPTLMFPVSLHPPLLFPVPLNTPLLFPVPLHPPLLLPVRHFPTRLVPRPVPRPCPGRQNLQRPRAERPRLPPVPVQIREQHKVLRSQLHKLGLAVAPHHLLHPGLARPVYLLLYERLRLPRAVRLGGLHQKSHALRRLHPRHCVFPARPSPV